MIRSGFAASLRSSNRVAGLAALLLLWAVGCGDNKTTLVKGVISYCDEPLQIGAIRFYPEDVNVQSTGGVINNGKYSVRVFRGPMKVRITCPKEIGKTKLYDDRPDSPERPVLTELLPPKYNVRTELRLDVDGTEMNKDWELAK